MTIDIAATKIENRAPMKMLELFSDTVDSWTSSALKDRIFFFGA
jgi:hypothetical protein